MGNFFMSVEDKEILAKIEAFTPEELELYNKNNFISLKNEIRSQLFYRLDKLSDFTYIILNKTGKQSFHLFLKIL